MTVRQHAWAAGLLLAAVALLFPGARPAAAQAVDDGPASPCHQYYPNIPGKVLPENDKVVVQRFVFPPDQLYIHIKGGEWTVRYGDHMETGRSKTGSMGWYGPVELSADHESVNSGDEPIDLVWVTLKSGCMGKEWISAGDGIGAPLAPSLSSPPSRPL